MLLRATKSFLSNVTSNIIRTSSIAFYSKSTFRGDDRNRNRKGDGAKQKVVKQSRTPYFGERTPYFGERTPYFGEHTSVSDKNDRVKYDGSTERNNKYFYKKHRGDDPRHQYNDTTDRRTSKPSGDWSVQNKSQDYLNTTKKSSSQPSKHRVNDSGSEDEDESEIIKLKVPDWSAIEPLEINRNYFKSTQKPTQNLDDFHRENGIFVEGEAAAPILHFNELDISQHLRENLHITGNTGKFTPLQCQSIPIVLSGKNLIATGILG